MKVALLFALAACSDLDAQPNYADAVAAAQHRMHERFDSLARAQQALMQGDVDRVHAEATALAALHEPDVLAQWQPHFAAIRERAEILGQAPDPMAAAHAIAEVARRCASCHQATHATLTWADELAPLRRLRLTSVMAGHQYAAARMWEGLIGPSDARWLDGANRLAGAPIAITAESSALGIADDVAKVHLLARRAADVKDRAQLYGDLLATCAHCHAVIRDR
jgi:hypothetical protein